MNRRTTLVAAGMALILSASMTGSALASSALFSDTSSAGQQAQAAANASTNTASGSDVWVQDSIELTSDSNASWDLPGDHTPNCIIRHDYSSGGDTLLDVNGNELSQTYLDIESFAIDDQPYFAVQSEEGLSVNNRGCIDANGTLFTDMAYTDFEAPDEHWLCAITVTEVPETTTHEYSSGNTYYTINSVDLFYDEAKVATLDRDSYVQRPKVVDGYLLIECRDGSGYDVYVSTGEKVNHINVTYWDDDEEYYSDESGVLRHVSGVQVGTADCTLTYDDVKVPYFIGSERNVIYDIYGAQVATLDFNVYALYPFVNGYAVIDGQDGYGVVDSDWNVVIPCEYDQVGASYDNKTAFTQGYCYVEKDGKFGYYAADGTLSVPLDYDTDDHEYYGDLFSVISDGDAYRVVSAADGLLDDVYSDYYTSYNDQYSPLITVANDAGLWGLIDYHGNTLVDYAYESSYMVSPSADGSFVLVEAGSTANSVTILHIGTSLSGGAAADTQTQTTAAAGTSAAAPAASASAEEPTTPTDTSASATTPTTPQTDATPQPSDSAETENADAVTVQFGGLQMSIPLEFANNMDEEDISLMYTNDAGTMAVAIYDETSVEIPAGTDLSTYFTQVTQGTASQYTGATVEDLGTGTLDDGTTGYAFGITVPADGDAYDIVLMYIPLQSGFSFVELGYAESTLTEADQNTLTQIIDSISVASSSDTQTASAAEDASGASTSNVSSVGNLFATAPRA